tara:strand:- start:468 stop:722 length:255 start_codon:yes stop_codon:yes gene_type:complete
MKVGDLVELSQLGWAHSYYEHRKSKYGIVLGIVDEQRLMMNGRYKDNIAYRIRWFDKQGNPVKNVIGFERKMIKHMNKKKSSNV